MSRRFFTQDEAREMYQAIDSVERVLTAWGVEDKAKLWQGKRGGIKVKLEVDVCYLQELSTAYEKLNDIVNRRTML